MSRIQYELEYTEGISQRMRIPEMLKVAPQAEDPVGSVDTGVHPSVIMQVPERIVVAGQHAVDHLMNAETVLSVFINDLNNILKCHWCLSSDCNLTLIWLCYGH